LPPEQALPGSAEQWLTRARSDLALAGVPLPAGAVYDDLCYHAQQAAEKAIKAVYRSRGLEFRYTHDLAALLSGLRRAGVEPPGDVAEADDLTDFATEGRYPGVSAPVNEAEYRNALAIARRVVNWAASIVEG
jgi:HEPN domain-containing protein